MAAVGAKGLNPDAELRLENTGHPAANTFTLAHASRSHVHALGLGWDDVSGKNNGQYAPFSWKSASSPVTGPPRRDRVIIWSCLVLLTALAWTYLVHLDHQMSAAMEHDRMMADMGMTMDMPWHAADVFFTFAMWAVMMVGMMTASAAPVVLLFAGIAPGRGAQRAPRVVFAFGAGYLLVWTAFSGGRRRWRNGRCTRRRCSHRR